MVKKLKNASKQTIEDQKKLLITNIKTCPFILEQYWLLLKNLGDKDHELERLLSFLRVDELLENEKRKLINQIAESINHSEEESLKRGMNQLCKAETFLGYNAKELKNQIRTSLRIIDEKKRTVRDVMITESGQLVEGKEIVFSSHKKADTAREIIITTRKLYEVKITEKNYGEIQNKYKYILDENLNIGVAQSVLEEIKKQIDKYEQDRKTVTNVILDGEGKISEGTKVEYDTYEEAQFVREGIRKALTLYDKDVSDKTETEIRNEYKQICADIRSYGMATQVLDVIKKRLDDYDRKCKTVNGKVYNTREEAENAQKRTFNGVTYSTVEEAIRVKELTYDDILFNDETEKECYIFESEQFKNIIERGINFQEKINAYKQIISKQWSSPIIQEKIFSFAKEITKEYWEVIKMQPKKGLMPSFYIKSFIKIFALLFLLILSFSFGFLGIIGYVIILFFICKNIKKNYRQCRLVEEENKKLLQKKKEINQMVCMTDFGLLIRGTQIIINSNNQLERLTKIHYCTNCGHELEENWLSCPFCGKSI